MSKINFKGSALLAPVPPTLVSCRGADGKTNIITVAWTGIIASNPPTTYISLRPERYSHDIIKESGEFVINLCTEKLVRAADICGVKSGRDTDKFAICSLTAGKATSLKNCLLINESPINIECKVRDITSLGSHDMFIADIVSVDVDESLMGENGKIRFEKAGLVSYIHGEYFACGRRIGRMGFTVKKRR